MKTMVMAGTITGSVTRIIVRMLVAPETRAASSSSTFMLRKAGVSSITLSEMVFAIRWAQTMPGTL